MEGFEEAPQMLHIWNVKSVTLQTPILDGIKSWYLKKIPKESASRPILLDQACKWIHTVHASEIRRSPPNIATFTKQSTGFLPPSTIYRSCRSHTNWPNSPPLKKPPKIGHKKWPTELHQVLVLKLRNWKLRNCAPLSGGKTLAIGCLLTIDPIYCI